MEQQIVQFRYHNRVHVQQQNLNLDSSKGIQISIIQADRRYQITVPPQLCVVPFSEFKILAIQSKLIPYSSRIHLYTTPLTSISTLDFIDQNIHSLSQIRQYYGSLALAINNTQFKQEIQSLKYQPGITTKQNLNPLSIVVQIAQQNHFIHQNYSFSENYQVSFVKSLLQRYGHSLFAQYYTIRIPLSSFGDKESILNSLCRMKDNCNRVTLYVSTYDQNQTIATIRGNGNLKVNYQKYVQLMIEDYSDIFILDRRVKWNVVGFLFSILFKQPLLLQDNVRGSLQLSSKTEYQLTKDQTLVKIKKLKSPLFQFPKQIRHCNLIGERNRKAYIFERSNIIHVYSLGKQKFRKIKHTILESTQSENNDQQYAFLTQNHLIIYSVNINYIVLKHYDPDTCAYLYTRRCRHCFEQKFKLQFHFQNMVLDILVVSIKKNFANHFRVFKVETPEQFIEIQNISNPEKCRVFVARKGINCFSDRTGQFAFVDQQSDKVIIYSFFSMNKVCQFGISLSSKGKRVNCINFGEQKKINNNVKGQMLAFQRQVAVEYSNNQVHVYRIKYRKEPLHCLRKQNQKESVVYSAQFLFKFSISADSFSLYGNGPISIASANYISTVAADKKHYNQQNQPIYSLKEQKDDEIRIPQQFIIMEAANNTLNSCFFVKDNPFLKRSIKGIYLSNLQKD